MNNSQLLGLALLTAAIPKASLAAEPALYAYQGNPFGSNKYGIYKMGLDGEDRTLLWQDQLTKEGGRNMLSGWIRDGKLCGIIGMYNGFSLGDANNNFYVERDLLTGDILKQTPISVTPDNYTNFFVAADYCPYDNFIYGVGKNANSSGYAFKKCPADNLNDAVIINTGYGLQTGICFNEDWGMFVSVIMNKVSDIEYSAELDEIDINTGERTKLFDLDPDVILDYNGIISLKWIPSRQKYYWNAWSTNQAIAPVNENASRIIEIDPFTGECKTISDLPWDFNINYFALDGDKPYEDPAVPAAPSAADYTMDGDAVSLTFTLPAARNDGSPIDGEIGYSVFQGSRKLLSGKGTAGAPVTSEPLALEEGTYFLRIQAEEDGKTGSPAIVTVFIGKDVPFSPTNVVLTETTLSWDPVTSGQHGSELSGVTYQVSVNGTAAGTTTDTSFDVSPFIDSQKELTRYTAEVKAVVDGISSSPSSSNSIIAGKPWSAPFEVTPDEHDFGLCTLQDIDGDETNWSLYNRTYDDEPVFLSGFNSTKATEDWIFFPAFTGDRTSVYTLSFDVSLAQEDLVNGEIQSWIGTSPSKDGMKRCLTPSTFISTFESTNYFADFVIDGELAAAPALYIGIAASSKEKENSPLMVNNVKVSRTASDLNRPSAVTELTAVPSEKNPDMAVVSFRLPDTLLDGTAIPSTATLKARVKVIGMQYTDVTGAPGESVTTEALGYSGYNMFVVTPQLDDKNGLGANAVCHLGFGRPGPVRNLRVSYPEDNLGLRIDWDAPDTDYDGKPASGGTFSYKVWQLNTENKYELAVEVPIGLSYADVTMSENFTLCNVEAGVTAVNNEGMGPMTRIVAQVGNPHKMPLDEDFNGDRYMYEPLTPFTGGEYENAEYKWGTPSNLDFLPAKFDVADAGDVIAVHPKSATTGETVSRIWIPKFATTGFRNVSLELYAWTGSDAAGTTITAWAYGMEAPETIATLPAGKADGYEKVSISLPEKMWDKSWVQISIDSKYPSVNDRFVMAGYKVDGTAGVDGVNGTILGTIKGGEGIITMLGFEGRTAEVYTLDGHKAAVVKVGSDIFSFNMEKGIYIVKAGSQSAKVSVR